MSAQGAAASNFDPAEWDKKDFSERVRIGTNFYVLQGLAYPFAAYAYHAVRVMLFIAGWMFFASFTPGLGSPWNVTEWMFQPQAFQKAFLWAGLVEVMGLSCMSGPLGLRIWPPFTACLHYGRPGTTKLAPFPSAPVIGGHTRSFLDVLFYFGLLASLLRALMQPELAAHHLVPIFVFLGLCALVDKTIPLCARVEHHYMMILCFLLAPVTWISAAKWVQLAIWFWAGVSKLTVAFAYVVPIMTANNPLLKSPTLRRKLFVNYPEDLHPSMLAKAMAHAGTFLEFAAPLTLVFVTGDGPLLWIGMVFVVMLHGFIISNMPIAAVFEWNILSLYAGFYLFWAHPEVSLFAVGSIPLSLILVVGLLILPALGNQFPALISFLISMRYYAGNWAWNAWLFKNDARHKLDKLKRAAPLLYEQQRRFLPAEQAVQADSGFLAFRTLHLQGRMLGKLLPKALGGNSFRDYLYADGETVSASIVGWNFGEGHSSNESLIEAIQAQCQFEDGEVRVICVESQPILGSSLHYRVVDAKRGVIEEGYAELSDLARRSPWDYGEI